jgi:guanine deaminase
MATKNMALANMAMKTIQIHRAALLHFPHTTSSPEEHYQFIADGVLVVEDGIIAHIGEAAEFFAAAGNRTIDIHTDVITHRGLLMPGLIDSHVHFAQTEMIGSYGKQLLDWLNSYTFPTELQFAHQRYANEQAQFFIEQLFAHGTTTASVYATVHPSSVNAFFSAAEQFNARMICGKVMMDRHCPEALQDTPETGYHESKTLIERWHNNGRALYAITPRFAPTSTPEQLSKAGQLAQEHPDVFIQTHLSENLNEIDWVKRLFPTEEDYLAVYQRHHLVRDRTLLGHAVHLNPREITAIKQSGAAICFCPSSNLFLGSGLFPYQEMKAAGIPVALASDIGAGTSLSLLRNQSDAYKIGQLQGSSLNAFEASYLCTQGAAVAMGLEDKIGNLNPGSEADFIVIDFDAFPMLSQRVDRCTTLAEKLFALMILGDERVIATTYVHGRQVYSRSNELPTIKRI